MNIEDDWKNTHKKPWSSLAIALDKNVEHRGYDVNPILMMVKELGDIAGCLVYSQHRPDCASSYKQEMSIALAELLAMVHIMIERLGFDWDYIECIAWEHLKDKVEELKGESSESKSSEEVQI